MTRDYKNTRSTKKPEKSCLVISLIGLVIGTGIGFGVQFQRLKSLASAPVAIAPEVLAPAPLKPPEPVGPSYDFYTLLPDLEVKVGDPEKETTGGQAPAAATPTAAKPAPAKAAATPSELYVLQAGSFRKTSEAETMKANLALLGVESTVQSVNVGDELWHRVFIGPYKDPVYVEKLQKQLKQNQVNTLLVKSGR